MERSKQTEAATVDLLINMGDPGLNLEWKSEMLMRCQDLRMVVIISKHFPPKILLKKKKTHQSSITEIHY